MASSPCFLVPWRSDGGWREELWKFTRQHWESECVDIKIIEGSSPDGPFNRSAAINAAAVGDWDVAVVLDADVIASPEQVYQAIERAENTGRLTFAYERFVGLNKQMTKRILAGFRGDWERGGSRFKSETHESSIVAIPHILWDELGGFDERFVGWGQEDVAFTQAARVIGGGIERIPGIVWHLWHPRQPERSSLLSDYKANQRLGMHYRRTHDMAEMRALIEGRGPVRQKVFTDIYLSNEWRGKKGTRAGPGSSLAATEQLRTFLPALLDDLGVSSVLDAGCNDSLWMPELLGYVGVDIVPHAVKAAKNRYPDRDYRVMDICADELPNVDAVICRDALQHLSFADGLAALENFRRAGAKWLLANTHRGGKNVDIASGGWYEIDLEAEPFSLGVPEWEIPDGAWEGHNRYPNKVFGVWTL